MERKKIMNICDHFRDTFLGFKDTYDVFTNMYYIKRAILMLENINGEFEISIMSKQQKSTIQQNLQEITTLYEFSTFIKRYKCSLEDAVPKKKFKVWSNGDFRDFADKYHHRSYWNEIPNHFIIEVLIEKFCSLYRDCKIRTDTDFNPEICTWNLRLYDFNDFDLYFTSKENLEKFAGEFELDPYSVYSKQPEETVWTEEYTV